MSFSASYLTNGVLGSSIFLYIISISPINSLMTSCTRLTCPGNLVLTLATCPLLPLPPPPLPRSDYPSPFPSHQTAKPHSNSHQRILAHFSSSDIRLVPLHPFRIRRRLQRPIANLARASKAVFEDAPGGRRAGGGWFGGIDVLYLGSPRGLGGVRSGRRGDVDVGWTVGHVGGGDWAVWCCVVWFRGLLIGLWGLIVNSLLGSQLKLSGQLEPPAHTDAMTPIPHQCLHPSLPFPLKCHITVSGINSLLPSLPAKTTHTIPGHPPPPGGPI